MIALKDVSAMTGGDMIATVFFYVDSATGELQRTNSTDPDYVYFDVPDAVARLRLRQPAAVRAEDAATVVAALRQVQEVAA